MKALCLFGVLLLARILVLIGGHVPLSFWSPAAFLWQDLLVALVFAMFERMTARRPWIAWTVYGATAMYLALNLPLVRLMSSPMTLPMLRATRGALADSVRHHLTAENLLLILLVLGAAAMLPVFLRRLKLPPPVAVGLGITSVALIASGPAATARVETNGLHRNVFFALLETALPRVSAHPAESSHWRRSPASATNCRASSQSAEGLSRLKGAAQGRNVVLILLESTGAKYLKPYGAAEDPMPRLTALAHQAILFENAYAVYPESIKGLFSVLCSRYPALDTKAEACAQAATPSIASELASEDYRTALFHSGRFMYLGMEEVIQHRGFETLEDAGDIGGNHESSFGVDDTATAGRMLNWVDSLPRTEKFFITYLPIAGHHPYDTPEPGPFSGHDELARYRNALYYSDAVLGEFLDGMKARGLFEKTLFVIFGDHGEAFGQHAADYGHTLFIYDENLRVPYLIVAPGIVREQISVCRAASLIDTGPTILDLLGLPIPEGYQGASLLEPTEQMALFYTDYSLALLGLRDGRWKFIYELESGRAKLFDLAADPDETKNCAAWEPERVNAYRSLLRGWASAQRDMILHPQNHSTLSQATIPRPDGADQ